MTGFVWPRYLVISETRGLVWSCDDAEYAERIALIAAVNTARSVHLHDRVG